MPCPVLVVSADAVFVLCSRCTVRLSTSLLKTSVGTSPTHDTIPPLKQHMRVSCALVGLPIDFPVFLWPSKKRVPISSPFITSNSPPRGNNLSVLGSDNLPDAKHF